MASKKVEQEVKKTEQEVKKEKTIKVSDNEILLALLKLFLEVC